MVTNSAILDVKTARCAMVINAVLQICVSVVPSKDRALFAVNVTLSIRMTAPLVRSLNRPFAMSA